MPVSVYADAALEKAAGYGRDVLSGKVVAGSLLRLSVERHYRDIESGSHRGLYFCDESAARALHFFSYLKHSKDKWMGQPIVLEPWQCWIIACVFGWMREDSGNRRFTTVYEEVGRKNGKTTKIAGVGLYGLTKDVGGPEIYSAATKRDQAKLLFDAAAKMVRQSKPLRARLDVQNTAIKNPRMMGVFEPLSADANSLDGLNPSMGLVDELHAHRNSEIWDVLISAIGARSAPLMWAITTAGFNRMSICYELRSYAIKVLSGLLDDDSFFAVIYTIDEGDEWQDESCWGKANPNLGISKSLEYLRGEALKAASMPTALTNFYTKHLNVWVSAESLWCNVDKWALCAKEYTLEILDTAELVYGGLDLSTVSDITSLGLVGIMEDGPWFVWGKHYLPEGALDNPHRTMIPYRQWADEGWLTLTPGDTLDYDWIENDVLKLSQRMNIEEIAFDRWNSSQLVNNLTDKEIPMVAFGQGYASMNAPMKELERRYLGSSISHPNDPVLNWCMSNVVAQQDPAGNIKPAKDKSAQKIDPAVALIMAVGRAIYAEDTASVYETMGLYI